MTGRQAPGYPYLALFEVGTGTAGPTGTYGQRRAVAPVSADGTPTWQVPGLGDR